MVLRLLCLVCLISVPLLSLSQESGKAKPRVPVTKSPEAVSKAGIIYVAGDAHKPMGVSMKDTGPITVLKALATAEGANPTASLHHAKIIRKGENGTTEFPVDIKQIMQAKAPDVTLQADDILFVPRSVGKSARKPQYEDFYDVPPSQMSAAGSWNTYERNARKNLAVRARQSPSWNGSRVVLSNRPLPSTVA